MIPPKELRFYDRGKRGEVFIAFCKNKKLAVKVKRASSKADTLQNEAYWLKRLNKHGIGPRFFFFDGKALATEFVEGETLEHYARTRTRKEVKALVAELLRQARTLDVIGVNKHEMHRPVKHVIVRQGKPVLIDFERCRFSRKPKNVTQLCQFLTSRAFSGILGSRGIALDRKLFLSLARKYKKSPGEEEFSAILGLLSSA